MFHCYQTWKKYFVAQYKVPSSPSSSGPSKALAFLLKVASSSDHLNSWKSGRWSSSSMRLQNAAGIWIWMPACHHIQAEEKL